uniref:Uncharacterized protein n=1 Tax=Globodera rostochiensis TaxID=31243 RepID=A0A914HE23_GLORO
MGKRKHKEEVHDEDDVDEPAAQFREPSLKRIKRERPNDEDSFVADTSPLLPNGHHPSSSKACVAGLNGSFRGEAGEEPDVNDNPVWLVRKPINMPIEDLHKIHFTRKAKYQCQRFPTTTTTSSAQSTTNDQRVECHLVKPIRPMIHVVSDRKRNFDEKVPMTQGCCLRGVVWINNIDDDDDAVFSEMPVRTVRREPVVDHQQLKERLKAFGRVMGERRKLEEQQAVASAQDSPHIHSHHRGSTTSSRKRSRRGLPPLHRRTEFGGANATLRRSTLPLIETKMSSSAVRTPTRFSPATFFTMAMPSGVNGGGITANCGQQQQRHPQQQCSHVPTTVPSFIGGTPKLRNRQKRGPPMRSQQRQQDATALGKTANGAINCLKSPNGSTTADKKQQQTRSKCQQFGGGGVAGETTACATATTPSRPQQLFRHSIRREQSASAIVILPRRCNTNNANGFGTVYGTAHPYAGCYTPPSAIFSYEDHEVSPIFAGPKFIESPAAKSLPLPPSQWLEKGLKTQQKQGEEEAVINALEQDEDDADEGDDEADAQEVDNNNDDDKPLAKQFGGLTVLSSGGRGHSSSSSSESSTSSSSSSSDGGGGGGGSSGVEQHFNGFIPGSWSPPTAAAATTSASNSAIIVKPVTVTPIGIRMDPLHLIAATVMFT